MDVEEKADASDSDNIESERLSTDSEDSKDTLVVVFSATGNTKAIAEKIVSITDADLYEIIPAKRDLRRRLP